MALKKLEFEETVQGRYKDTKYFPYFHCLVNPFSLIPYSIQIISPDLKTSIQNLTKTASKASPGLEEGKFVVLSNVR